MSRLGGTVLTLVWAAASGCAPADACAEMCAAALDSFEVACLDGAGQDWGESVGYTDRADYENGCDTYAWELRELGQADSCASRLAVFQGFEAGGNGDGASTCAEYYDAWEVE